MVVKLPYMNAKGIRHRVKNKRYLATRPGIAYSRFSEPRLTDAVNEQIRHLTAVRTPAQTACLLQFHPYDEEIVLAALRGDF